jgi:hypothetical protein
MEHVRPLEHCEKTKPINYGLRSRRRGTSEQHIYWMK